MTIDFPPTRTAALETLQAFVPKAGRDYTAKRNYDLPDQGHPYVSHLSPYLRHRVVTEEEVLRAVLGRYALSSAEKFVQEVCWRTYWKGWLELRPGVWSEYLNALERLETTDMISAAEAGQTEIDAFNAWAHELRNSGYLHNHARMWFASIWIFTLNLPWQAGADFFMRHLLDGDPASNTLSWRWVAGLQTKGKHYLARSSNISKYTEGRHNPEWRLNTQAEPLNGPDHPDRRPLRKVQPVDPSLRTVALLHDDDLSPDTLLPSHSGTALGIGGLLTTGGRSPGDVHPKVLQFAKGAMSEALNRWGERFGGVGVQTGSVTEVLKWTLDVGAEQIVTPYAPVGPGASKLRALRKEALQHGLHVAEVLRPWDQIAWPHATHGFFRFKKKIPELIETL